MVVVKYVPTKEDKLAARFTVRWCEYKKKEYESSEFKFVKFLNAIVC